MVNSVRRYYLGKRHEERSQLGDGQVWQSKQEAEPGTPLPSTFPHLSTLKACGYTTSEDLDGADVAELQRAGITRSQALDIIAAL